MPIGIIAGAGELPLTIARELKESGKEVVIVGLKDIASEALKEHADTFSSINIGKVGEIISFLKKNKVKDLILAGKVDKKLIYERDSVKPDWRAMKMLFSAKLKGDNELLSILEQEFLKEGIKLVDITKCCPNLLTPEGVLTKREPSKEQWDDIALGVKVARKIGELDIGQAVAVKEGSVIAVEAIEGTDEMIIRAGNYVKDAVIVKVSKPQQTLKLDPPAVGLDTIEKMKTARAKVIALEAYRSILINRQEFLKRANEYGMIVVGVKLN